MQIKKIIAPLFALLLLAGAALPAASAEEVCNEIKGTCFGINWKTATVADVDGLDVKARSKNERTPLMWAAGWNADPQVIRALLDAGADVNARDKREGTALHLAAAFNDNPEIGLVLLKAGADADARRSGYEKTTTALMLASGDGGKIELMRALLEASADVNASDLQRAFKSAASYNENPEAIRMLLEAGADVNASCWRHGWTPLMEAAQDNNNPEILHVLLDAGADVNARSDRGFTALMFAVRPNLWTTKEENFRKVHALLDAGADVNARSDWGITALMQAARWNSNPEIIRTLLDAGADIDSFGVMDREEFGGTAHIWAARWNSNPEIIQTLLDADANIDADKHYIMRTALIWATINGNSEVIHALLDAGVDVKIKDYKGKTAWDYIQENETLQKTLENTDAYRRLQELQN